MITFENGVGYAIITYENELVEAKRKGALVDEGRPSGPGKINSGIVFLRHDGGFLTHLRGALRPLSEIACWHLGLSLCSTYRHKYDKAHCAASILLTHRAAPRQQEPEEA